MSKNIKMPERHSKKQAKRGLAIFFTLLVFLATPAYWLILAGITRFAILFPPAIVTRVLFTEN
jgi:hypothetical protein